MDLGDCAAMVCAPGRPYGRYRVLASRDGGIRVAIGPHWYISVVALAAIGCVGYALFSFLRGYLSGWLQAVYLAFWLVCLASLAAIILLDPGIVPRALCPADGDAERRPAGEASKCTDCNRWRESASTGHCASCDICIEGYDHHCPWIGKCVGRKNQLLFYVFVGSLPALYAFTVVCGVSVSFAADSAKG